MARPKRAVQGWCGRLISALLILAASIVGCAGHAEKEADEPTRTEVVPVVERPAKAGLAEKADIRAVARGNNAFAFDLYREMAREGNLFFSPFSVSTALSMTYAGARHSTAKEMSKVLHYPFEGDRLHQSYAGVLGSLSDVGKTGAVKLSVANALWGPHDYSQAFLGVNKDCYAATVRKITLVGAEPIINKWAEDHTAGRIKGLLSPGSLNDHSLLVLTNATTFEGEWNTRFDKSETRDESFRPAGAKEFEVPMMGQTASFRYLHVGKGEPMAAQLLELPYKGSALSMVIVLPDEDEGLGAVERTLTAEKLEVWLTRMERTKVRVRLPRFEIKGKTVSLKEPLQKLGMVEAFTSGKADFTGMGRLTGNVFIDKVLHQSFVEVHEKGTKAAAATAVIVGKDKDVGEDRRLPVTFIADHPFVFLIRDTQTGCILFLCRLHSPK